MHQSQGRVTLSALYRSLPASGRARAPPIGPRTHGEDDPTYVAIEEEDRVRTGVESAAPEPAATRASPILMEMAAAGDPTLKFAADCEARALRWLPRLKELYQSLRCGAKRPWPEFLAALTSGVHLTDADCDCVYLLTQVPLVGTVAGWPTMSEALKDRALDTRVLGGDGRWRTLADFVRDDGTAPDLRTRAARLGLSTRCTRAAMEQKVASRLAEVAYLSHCTATGV